MSSTGRACSTRPATPHWRSDQRGARRARLDDAQALFDPRVRRASHDVAPCASARWSSARRDVPAVGARRAARRPACWRNGMRCSTVGDGWFDAHGSGRRRRNALQVSHRRRDRRSGPGVALSARGCAWPERGDRARPSIGRRPTGEAGRGTNACFSNCMSARSRREGTFQAAIEKLDHVADTGFTAIELMPVADFAGRWNWGYDGVLLFAPDSAYGRPDDLKALIDAAHQRGLMVFLDVVYNHFGPEGNYLGRYAPQFFTHADTPWGSAIDYRVPRSARLRHRECAVLACRLSIRRAAARCGACHCRAGPAPTAPRAQRSGWKARGRYRPAHPSGARERRQPGEPARSARASRRAATTARSGTTTITTRCHVLLTGETHGYYRDYRDTGAASWRARWPKASPIKASRRRTATAQRAAKASGALPPTAFVNFLQNHDQIGNRAVGRAARRPRRAAGDRSRACRYAARAVAAADVHGRGVGRAPAVSVLLRFQRAIWPRRCARAGSGSSLKPIGDMADDIPDPLAEADVSSGDARLGCRAKAGTSRAARRSCAICSRRAGPLIIPASPNSLPGHGRCDIDNGVCWRGGIFEPASAGDPGQPRPRPRRDDLKRSSRRDWSGAACRRRIAAWSVIVGHLEAA